MSEQALAPALHFLHTPGVVNLPSSGATRITTTLINYECPQNETETIAPPMRSLVCLSSNWVGDNYLCPIIGINYTHFAL